MEDLLQEQVVEVVEGSLTLDQHPLEVVQELDTKVMVELLVLLELVVVEEDPQVDLEFSSLLIHTTLLKENS
jgi:hypothetical protein